MWSQLCRLQNSVTFNPCKIEDTKKLKWQEKSPTQEVPKRSEAYDSGLSAKASKAEVGGCG